MNFSPLKLRYAEFLGNTSTQFQSELCAISLVNYSQPVTEEWHSHEALHLSLILQGGNREFRKKEDIEVNTGKIMMYREGVLHCNRHTEYPSKNLNIELKTKFLEQYQLNNDIFESPFIEHTDLFLGIINIYYELIINDSYNNSVIQESLMALFAKENTSSFRPNWMIQLRELIKDRWDEFIPLDELSLELQVHPVTISKYFRKYHQCTLGDYMRKIKIQRAIHFLLHTPKKITEIAFLCGFSDQSHMNRVFKAYIGFRPKDIRSLL